MRLIDADNLCFENQHYNKSQLKAILDFLDAQPTAYDVDKVVNKLEEMSGIQYDCENGGCQFNDCIHTPRAIEIVMVGGANDTCCRDN